MAGYSNPSQALYTIIRELVENSLDACEDNGTLPLIEIDIKELSAGQVIVKVTDNGIGVPHNQIPLAFGTVLYGSKYNYRQRRGTFGLGVTMAVLYSQITSNCPTTIHSKLDNGQGKEYRLYIDVEKNTPIVEAESELPRDTSGTTVTLTLKGDFNRAKDRILEYLKQTSISSPHANLILTINDDPKVKLGGAESVLPTPSTVSKLHPHAADIELLRRMVSINPDTRLNDFLINAFQQIGTKTANRFLRFMNMDARRTMSTFGRDDLTRLSTALRQYDGFSRPDGNCLSPIGEEIFLKSITRTYNSSEGIYAKRGPSEWDGHPFIIECILVVSDQFSTSEAPSLYRFANRVPLLYDGADDVFTKAMRKINWSRYGVGGNHPTALFVHFCSSRVPYKAAGKQSIAPITQIESEALSLFRELGRKLGKVVEKKTSSARDKKKHKQFNRTFRLVAKFSAELAESERIPETATMTRKLFEVNSDV